MLVVAVVWKLNKQSVHQRGDSCNKSSRSEGHSDLGFGLFHFERTVSLNTGRRECVRQEMVFTQLVSRTLITTPE